ncbi:DciA family protein [Streptomyces sp. NBC_01353]|uniref:DciA family protein n=1 Tax=Streptomyces sp. NBC_01353 TaxID=2903835 RepID=UPI002E2F5EA0|nr:DciA family protein [Streptomyces sp. NBC_01353]
MTDPSSTPAHSGADLARQALAAYKASRSAGPTGARPAKARHSRRTAGTGRDPVGFGSVLGQISAEQGWADGVRGGSILDRWDELCPQYTGRVQAVAFDADRGRLDVRPGSDAYAAQLRLLGGQLCRQINTKLDTDTVTSIRILPVGRIDTPTTPAAPEAQPAAATGPVRTRETASDGYHRALAVHREHHQTPADETPFARAVAEARARQDAALSTHRLPAEEHSEYLAELDRLTKDQPTGELEATVQAALRYKHGGQSSEPQPVFKTA